MRFRLVGHHKGRTLTPFNPGGGLSAGRGSGPFRAAWARQSVSIECACAANWGAGPTPACRFTSGDWFECEPNAVVVSSRMQDWPGFPNIRSELRCLGPVLREPCPSLDPALTTSPYVLT